LPDDYKNENEPLSFSLPTVDGPIIPEAKPFAPEQMVRCDECLRANSPTRVECLYCGVKLPFNEALGNLQKPTLRPLEKWEQGYNNIVLPSSANHLQQEGTDTHPSNPIDTELAEAADLLKLNVEDVARVLSFDRPLPLARASNMDEARLVQRRLGRLRIDTVIVADAELGLGETLPVRVRAIAVEPDGFIAYQTPETPGIRISWFSLTLAVVGRLVTRRVELREQKTSRAENRILDSNEFFSDELALEFYTAGQSTPYRINANTFDFSCLGAGKTFVAGENLLGLVKFFREHAPQLKYDDSYSSARKVLEPVWPSQKQNEAGGWRRDRPGKISVGSATEISNGTQFLRYSRLRHYFEFKARERKDEDA